MRQLYLSESKPHQKINGCWAFVISKCREKCILYNVEYHSNTNYFYIFFSKTCVCDLLIFNKVYCLHCLNFYFILRVKYQFGGFWIERRYCLKSHDKNRNHINSTFWDPDAKTLIRSYPHVRKISVSHMLYVLYTTYYSSMYVSFFYEK